MASTFVLFPGNQQWVIAIVSDGRCQIVQYDTPADTSTVAALIAKSLHKHGYRGEAVMLALPSRLCLCANVDEKGLRNRNRDAGLYFRLEERLPLALEEMVADFIPGQDQSLGVAVAIDAVEPIILALEDQGIVISSVCPAALLLADEVLKQGQVDVVMCGLDGNVDCIDTGGG